VDPSKEMEEYWTKAVQDFMKLGLKEAKVPIGSFSFDTAKAIALKLGLTVDVSGKDYVYRQNTGSELT